MCDIQNNGKIQREFETRSTDDQPTIQWLPVVGSWTFLGVNMHFNEKLFMCDSCNFLVRAYLLSVCDIADLSIVSVNNKLKLDQRCSAVLHCTEFEVHHSYIFNNFHLFR